MFTEEQIQQIKYLLLVNPGVRVGGVVHDFLSLEPEVDLVLGTFGAVRAVANISANVNAEVTTDGAGLRVRREEKTAVAQVPKSQRGW